ncbi:hypothetical protein Bca52824_030105 [Brassica carinata]|uniref:Putative gamma-glutamylcyclotransferase n=1 Tax=Brassica carinata TaxID=52824 RepID=A0A8X7V413_BRACI|nr:hypothetical protein Bca52824_030105 [Brassica carinata]
MSLSTAVSGTSRRGFDPRMHSGHRLRSTSRLVYFTISHRYRLKGRLHPCIAPSETGVINGKVLTGLTNAQLENLDMIEGAEYERKTVEVVLTDTSEKMQVAAFIWANKDDPDMYGEWDFEEWKRLYMEKFIEASKKFIEWKKNPNGRTREEFEKFVHEDPPMA